MKHLLVCLTLLAPLLGCFSPTRPMEYTKEDPDQQDTAYARQQRLQRGVDSVDSAWARRPRLPACEWVWREDLGDSAWDCPDPRPPASPSSKDPS